MGDYITLLGADDVRSAGSSIRQAAETMQRAASQIEQSLNYHRVFLGEWLTMFEETLHRKDEDNG